jgi:hypothetical protein
MFNYEKIKDSLKINTSNPLKLKDFNECGLFLPSTSVDIHEPYSNQLDIIAYKAAQAGEGVIVDDAALFVEGTDIGVDIKHREAELVNHFGKTAAEFNVLGVLIEGKVYVFVSRLLGQIVEPQTEIIKMDYDDFLKPVNQEVTLRLYNPDEFNLRKLNVQKMINNQVDHTLDPIYTWEGKFQD